MSKKHVIAMDTHSQTTDICVKTRANGPGRWHHVKTTLPELAAVIEQVRGPRELVLEEGPLAGWLLRNLQGRVEKAEERVDRQGRGQGRSDRRGEAGGFVSGGRCIIRRAWRGWCSRRRWVCIGRVWTIGWRRPTR